MDLGYDFNHIYENILFDYNGQAVTPINKRNAKQPPTRYYDFDGTPCCSTNHKMVYWSITRELTNLDVLMSAVK